MCSTLLSSPSFHATFTVFSIIPLLFSVSLFHQLPLHLNRKRLCILGGKNFQKYTKFYGLKLCPPPLQVPLIKNSFHLKATLNPEQKTSSDMVVSSMCLANFLCSSQRIIVVSSVRKDGTFMRLEGAMWALIFHHLQTQPKPLGDRVSPHVKKKVANTIQKNLALVLFREAPNLSSDPSQTREINASFLWEKHLAQGWANTLKDIITTIKCTIFNNASYKLTPAEISFHVEPDHF